MVTVWPAADSEMPSPALISGKIPAGMVSSMIVRKPLAVRARRLPSGSR
jgi:hypothetical protein